MPQEETLDVLGYLRRLGKHVVPALGLAVLVMAALAAMSWSAKPTYSQKAHVLVMPATVSSEASATQQAQLIPMMMRTYVAEEDLPAYTKAVSEATGGKFTQEQVTDDLSIYWGGGSALLAFQATGSSLDDANELADAGAEVFTKMASTMVPTSAQWNPKLTVVQKDLQQAAPTGGRSSQLPTVAAGGVATFVVALLLLELVSAIRSRRRGDRRADVTTGGRTSGKGATRA